MKRYKYIDGTKVSNYPLLNTYLERMDESWQAKAFGITMPLWFIFSIALLFIFPLGEFNLLSLTLQGTASSWFIISYMLLINRQMRYWKDSIKL